ncbi:MAG: hypothetical protein GY838_11155 [bacterium]|nr:hypothetical protein [bacterium]
MRRLALLVTVLVLAAAASAHARPRVGLALSGGGAKGFAHIGVLQVLEEHHIPVDCIAGTSMGSVVGVLYAMGYPVAEIERLALETDWDDIFLDRVPRRDRGIEQKAMEDRYFVALPLVDGSIGLPRGLVAGQKISRLLARLTLPVHGVTDFDSLPRPFRAVATDIVTGEVVVLRRGYLPEAVRASMAIPSVFTPVEYQGRLLVDGLLGRNFPVQEAMDLGADLVIGVDVGQSLVGREELDDLIAIADQASALASLATSRQQRELADVLISPELDDASAMSFDRTAEIIAAGRAAAEAALPRLRELLPEQTTDAGIPTPVAPESFVLADVVFTGLHHVDPAVLHAAADLGPGATVTVDQLERAVGRIFGTGFFERVTYRIVDTPAGARIEFLIVEKNTDYFRFGMRFDSRDRLAAAFNILARNRLGHGSVVDLDLIIGDRNQILVHYTLRPDRRLPGLGLRLGYVDETNNVYVEQERLTHVDTEALFGEILLGDTFSDRLLVGAGARTEWAKFDPDLRTSDLPRTETDLVSLVALAWFDSQDRTYYPTSGLSFFTRHEYAAVGWNREFDFSRHYFDLKAFMPVAGRVSLLGHAVAGMSFGDAMPDHYRFLLGGVDIPALLLERRMTRVSFLGLHAQQINGRQAQFAQAGLQIEVGRRLFLIVRGNVGIAYEGTRFGLHDRGYLHGYGVTLGLLTPLGPVELTGAYGSNEELMGHLSVGMKF